LYNPDIPFSNLNYSKLEKANRMLRSEDFNLYSQLTTDTVFGVIKSQRDTDLLYACFSRADGSYSCQTQKLNPCGGLRGTICKHLIVLIGQIANYPATIPLLQSWINLSLRKNPINSKSLTKHIFSLFEDSTSSIVPNLNSEVIGFPFSNIECINSTEFQNNPFIINENSSGKPNIIILESHISFESKKRTIINLETNFINCIGDRKRSLLNEASSWILCNDCNNWICEECYSIFSTNTNSCPSAFLGIKIK
jgi:hypothetical protein